MPGSWSGTSASSCLAVNLGQDPVPQRNPLMHGFDGTDRCFTFFICVAIAQGADQLFCQWSVLAAIKLNMSMHVMFQTLDLNTLLGERFDQSCEHVGNDIFATVQEG